MQSVVLSKKRENPGKIKLSFSGHETFPFRYTWLKKAVEGVSEDPLAFSRESAIADFGVGKNMVASMRYWALVTSIIKESEDGFVITDFGKHLFLDNGWDPYLEDTASLWLLHWTLCFRIDQATSWYLTFNKLTHIEFTKEQLNHEIMLFATTNGFKKSANIIERDVDCLIRTYVPSKTSQNSILEDSLECPLTELGLIRELGQKGLYTFCRGYQRELPNEIFIYCLLEFWNNYYESRASLSFEDIAYAEGSPGQIFKIDEDSLAHRLDGLEKTTNGLLRYDETSRLRQVYRNRKEEDTGVYLKKYYKLTNNRSR